MRHLERARRLQNTSRAIVQLPHVSPRPLSEGERKTENPTSRDAAIVKIRVEEEGKGREISRAKRVGGAVLVFHRRTEGEGREGRCEGGDGGGD